MSTQAIAPVDKYDQREMVEVIKQTVCKGASDAQLKMFIEVCRSTGLNPFLKELYYVPEKGIIMAARDGYLRVANENPQFDGMETRVERDDKQVPIKAVCTVWRKDRNHPVICEAYFNEYRKSGPVWQQYPSAMISKVAEVLALKRSFAINGVVSEEEMGNDGRGSIDAAAHVAAAKLEALRAGVPAAQIAEVLPPSQEPPLADVLEASVEQARGRKKRPSASRIDLLQAFGDFKKRFKKIERESEYYKVLGEHGYRHSDEFPETDDGLKEARACYKDMSLALADLEARAKQAEQVTAV